jgi:hypothetical protein
MVYDLPLKKFAVSLRRGPQGVAALYRGREHAIRASDPELAARLLEACDGRTELRAAAARLGVPISEAEAIVADADAASLMLEGAKVVRSDGQLSGRELFWRMEKLLFEWRQGGPRAVPENPLDARIAKGDAPINVVRGFCLELNHLLRNVPEELALVVANAPTEELRLHFMEFYDEEVRHGEMLLEPLVTWFDSEEQIRAAAPLPTTTGLLQTYKAWAQKDVLLYATALMRDESSPLDAEIPAELDVYRGMAEHYDIPPGIVERYRWHANLDRECDHGFFAERIFACVPVISADRLSTVISALRQIIDLHEAFRWGVWSYYSRHDVATRTDLSLAADAGRAWTAKAVRAA